MRQLSEADWSGETRLLPVRCVRIAGEWSESWLYRTAAANGICPQQLGADRALAQNVRRTLDHVDWARGDATIAGPKTVEFCGLRVPRREVFTLHSKVAVCGACLYESCAIPALWRLTGYCSCHIHHTPLEDRCRQCRQAIGLASIVRQRCKCGASLTDPQQAPLGSSGPVRWGASVWPAGAVDPSSMPAETLASCILKSRLLIAVARSRRGRDVPLRGLQPAEHAELWLQREGLSEDFRMPGIKSFLDALSDPVHKIAAAHLLEDLIGEECASTTVFSNLPLREWRTWLAPLGLIDTRRVPQACQSIKSRRPDFEPLRTACKRTGFLPGYLKKQLAPEDLLSPIPYAAGRSVVLVRTSAVDLILEKRSADFPAVRHVASATSNRWTPPRTVARQLKNSGLLSKAPHELSRILFRRSQLGLLLARVRAKARPMEECQVRTLPLTHPAIYHRALSRSIGTLYESICAGTVPLYKPCAKPDFADLQLPMDYLPTLWRESARCYGRSLSSPGQIELF